MPRRRKLKLKCPTCKQAVQSTSEDFPFCSQRCRLIDLGKWASGQYVVSSPVKDISDETGFQRYPGPGDED
ncbi:MAG TPA: DNA gyrase inhibitor YacG [Terriglobales bacterium]